MERFSIGLVLIVLCLAARRFARLLRQFHQLFDLFVENFIARAAQPLFTDDPVVIDEVKGRPATNIPFGRDGSSIATLILERAPGDLVFFHLLLEVISILIGIHTNDGERLSFEAFHERPLMREHRHAGTSPESPEVEKDDLPSILGQLKGLVIQILAFESGSHLADRKVA